MDILYENMISVQNVTKDYNLGKTIVKALRGVSLDIDDGEFACISGPSGCGKTTFVSILSTLLSFEDGYCEVLGKDISKMNDEAKTALGIDFPHSFLLSL
jgi:putative ABC transport system ATP-binding protein